MADIIVNISDCPVSGLKRKAKHIGFNWQPEDKMLVIKTRTTYYQNNADQYGNEITDPRYLPYINTFIADNTEYVDANGNYVDPSTTGATPEYDYFDAKPDPISIRQLISWKIGVADSRGGFNKKDQ